MIDEIRFIVARLRPVLAQTLSDSMIAAWISGGESALNKLAPVLPPPMQPPSGGPPPADTLELPDEPDPIVRFPGIEEAADRILNSQTVSKLDYYAMRQQTRQAAFTISGDLEDRTIEKVRVLLAENLREGPSLRKFEQAVAETLDTLPITEAHLENVFRTNTLQAFSAANDATFRSAIVADAFPYRAYYATQDGRTRSSHEHLETAGIDDTNVYLADDPTWNTIRPPNDFNCRCRWVPQTIRQAARKGVTHAQQWLANIQQAKENGVYSGDDGDYRPNGGYVSTDFHPSPSFQR